MKSNIYNNQNRYDHYVVKKEANLLDWLLENIGKSKSKTKATLQGRGIKVNGKVVTQFDFMLNIFNLCSKNESVWSKEGGITAISLRKVGNLYLTL